MHGIGIPDQYIMKRGGWESDRVLKKGYRNVIDEEDKKFIDKVNTPFETRHRERQHREKKACFYAFVNNICEDAIPARSMQRGPFYEY